MPVSEDEIVVALGLVVAAVFVVRQQLAPLVTLRAVVAPAGLRGLVLLLFVTALGIVHATLTTMSSWDVQASGVYTAFYDLMGAAWIGGAIAGSHFLGLSLRDDVLERRNAAALVALGGVLLGHALAFAGGNIGEGPGWWCVVAASGLASASLFGVWLALHLAARVPDTLTVERDGAAAIRVAALFVACGLVFGRAAAGDWISMEDTFASFVAAGWPGFALAGAAVALEILLARLRGARVPAALSVVVALAYLGVAGYAVHLRGMPA